MSPQPPPEPTRHKPARPKPSKPATILDVAAAAGVSRQTVTRAMNSMPGIKASTMERVLQAAHELGYAPSRFARGLVQGAHVSVGLAIPDLENPYFPAFASSVVEHATARGWHVVVDDFGYGGRTALDAVERLSPQVDAIIGYLGEDANRARHFMARRPLVALDCPEPFDGAMVTFDYAHAAVQAVEHLRRTGRRNIVYLDSSSSRGDVSLRARAFAAALGASSVSEAVIRAQRESAEAAGRAVTGLLSKRAETDAIVAFNDVMAAGALKALAAGGRSVPQDCAVVGMDGISLGELVSPTLTTLTLDLRQVGRTAVELLDGLLSGEVEAGTPAAHRVIKPRLTVRGSA